MKRERLSLRAQAVSWLAQREHSELELRRKLLRRLQAQARCTTDVAQSLLDDVAGAERHPRNAANDLGAVASSDADRVNEVINWLRERRYLDEERFMASRVHVRADRYGLARIQQELSRHGLDIPQEAAQSLRSTELERATIVWQRKFGQAAGDAREAARQARFLVARGFSSDVVRKVLRLASHEPRDDHDST